jgi:hypothetical protein
MTDLATHAMDAHGGLDRWRRLKTVSARFQGGKAAPALRCAPKTRHSEAARDSSVRPATLGDM